MTETPLCPNKSKHEPHRYATGRKIRKWPEEDQSPVIDEILICPGVGADNPLKKRD